MSREAPAPIRDGRDNLVSRDLGHARLNGQVFTPDALADAVVAGLDLRPGARCVDPACGDGAFLAALARRSVREGLDLWIEGHDVDPVALDAARARCSGLGVHLRHADGLALGHGWDAVVGNPPYLEAKRMPDSVKERVRRAAPTAAHGAFDLYAAFVEIGARALTAGGELALVVPNRLLVTSSTGPLRARLAEAGVVTVEDRSAGADFGSVGVYPIVLRWRPRGAGAPRDGVGLDRAVVHALDGRWPLPRSRADGDLLARLLRSGLPRLDLHHEVRWSVSFHRGGLRDRFVSDAPAGPWARRFLGGGRFAGNREVRPFGLDWAGAWIDHDEGRARAVGNPLPPLSRFERPKVVLPQHVRRIRAALDVSGFVLKDTFLGVGLRDGSDAVLPLKWLLLVLHSRVFHVLFEAAAGGTAKRGGYLHALAGHLDPLPVPEVPDAARAERLHDALAAGEHAWDAAEALVRAAYGLSEEEAAHLDARGYPPF